MLKPNDKVFTRDNRYGELRYRVFEVERVTPTLAILGNGTKLKNTLKIFSKQTPYYNEVGQSYKSYYPMTDEIEKEISRLEFEDKLKTWYGNFKPTIEQMTQIYNLINQTP